MINASKREGILDLSYLKEMSGDSADFMIEMLDTLAEQIPVYLKDLKDAVVAEDWVAASGFAHKVKPTFYYVGREDLRDYMQKLEKDTKDATPDLKEMNHAMVELDQEVVNLMTQIALTKAALNERL